MADSQSVDIKVQGSHAEHVERDVAKVVHADGTVDYIDARAIGGDAEDLPKGYFRSPQFIGTVVVSALVPSVVTTYLSWRTLFKGVLTLRVSRRNVWLPQLRT